jgi:hypothetical protein
VVDFFGIQYNLTHVAGIKFLKPPSFSVTCFFFCRLQYVYNLLFVLHYLKRFGDEFKN